MTHSGQNVILIQNSKVKRLKQIYPLKELSEIVTEIIREHISHQSTP